MDYGDGRKHPHFVSIAYEPDPQRQVFGIASDELVLKEHITRYDAGEIAQLALNPKIGILLPVHATDAIPITTLQVPVMRIDQDVVEQLGIAPGVFAARDCRQIVGTARFQKTRYEPVDPILSNWIRILNHEQEEISAGMLGTKIAR